MLKFVSFTLIAYIACIVHAKNCLKIPKHYEELGCTAKDEGKDGCPTSFQCPDFNSMDKKKCHYKGRVYNLGEELDRTGAPSCALGCHCADQLSEVASFRCAAVDCPPHFSPEGETARIYENDNDCCPNYVPIKELKSQHICHVNGETYHVGETIYPETNDCYKCKCAEDYDNKTAVHENKNCNKINCGIELHNLKEITEGCVPLYFGEKSCCPIGTLCPSDKDKLVPSNLKSADESAGTCQFGNMTVKLNEEVETTTESCTKCRCLVPPMITCTKTYDC